MTYTPRSTVNTPTLITLTTTSMYDTLYPCNCSLSQYNI